MDIKESTKLILGYLVRLLPLSWLKWLVQSNLSPNLRNLFRLGLRDRDVFISEGVAAGLTFNAGKTNIDAVFGKYEPPLQQTFFNHLKPGDVVYDIGANAGFFTVIAAKLVGSSGKVYAFEPAPENAAIIRRNLQQNNFSNVTVIEKAVSASTGTAELLLAKYAGGHTLAAVGTPPDLKGSLAVQLVSIDRLVEQQEIEPPQFVKIDVEGAEIEVLKGMSQTIRQFKPTIIYEVDDETQEALLAKKQEIELFLENLNYKTTLLDKSYSQTTWNVENSIAIPK
jgi:FkbM family methyltransferase